MDIAVQNALATKKRIEAEISALKDRLRQIEAFISLYDEFASGSDPSEASPRRDPIQTTLMPTQGRKISTPDAVQTILEDGYPRTTATLLQLLDQQGIKVGGTRKIVNLSSALSRDPRFVNDRTKGWSLKPAPKVENPSSTPIDDGFDD